MGSKRPDQAHKDLLATDKKTRSQSDDEHIHEEDKQHLHEVRGKLAPKRGENPALSELKGRKRSREKG